jgi:hypothetical protein
MTTTRLLDLILRLYPPWWRSQYGEEVRTVSSDLLSDGRSVPKVVCNLFVGAVRARVTGAGAPRSYEHWAGRRAGPLSWWPQLPP